MSIGYYREGIMHEWSSMEKLRPKYHSASCLCEYCAAFNQALASAPRLTAIGFKGEGIREYGKQKMVTNGMVWDPATDEQYESHPDNRRAVFAIPVQEDNPVQSYGKKRMAYRDELADERFPLKESVLYGGMIDKTNPKANNKRKLIWKRGFDEGSLYERKFAPKQPEPTTVVNEGSGEEYPTYEQAGGNKKWDDMTELEQAYYNIRKYLNALAVSKNTIKRLRGLPPQPRRYSLTAKEMVELWRSADRHRGHALVCKCNRCYGDMEQYLSTHFGITPEELK